MTNRFHIPEHPGTELPVAEHGAILRVSPCGCKKHLLWHSGQIHRHATHPSARRNADPFQGENHRLSEKNENALSA